MITHKIIVVASPPPPPPSQTRYPYPTTVNRYNQHLKTKLGYNDYINRLWFKKGDTVIKTKDSFHFPYVKEAHKRVIDIQEVVHLCTFDEVTGLPKCMLIQGHDGMQEWVGVGDIFKLTKPKEGFEVPL